MVPPLEDPWGDDLQSDESWETAPCDRWHLGIDLGTTALAMVLRDRAAGRSYPLHWPDPNGGHGEPHPRLPAVAWLRPDQVAARSLADPQVRRCFLEPLPVGFEALARAATPGARGLLLQNFVADLQDALPWTVPGTADLEPLVLPQADRPVAFHWLVQAAAALLATPLAVGHGGPEIVGAVGLEPADLAAALAELATVTFTEPVGATAAYRFNLREAAIAAGLVAQPEQVAFVAEPLAALAGWLGETNPGENGPDTAIAPGSGTLLSMRVGASGGGFALASGRLPERVALHGFWGGGQAITEDVLCQLLCPTADDRAALHLLDGPGDHGGDDGPGSGDRAIPTPGQTDRPQRRQLSQRLQRSGEGRALLGMAERLKGQLQGIETLEVALALGDRSWRIAPQVWQEQVMGPWLERLNGELNQLLGRCGIAPERVDRVLCSGGTGTMVPVVRWLRQKFPWSDLVCDGPPTEPDAATRAAAGAARWGELPPALVPNPHPYDDYFLFGELLRALPETPIAIADLWRCLDERGINTRGSGDRLHALLNGELPVGLIPLAQDGSAIAIASRQRLDYAQLRDHSPFRRGDGLMDSTNGGNGQGQNSGGETYWRDREASFHWQRYLSSLWARGHQGMVEPIADCPDPLAIAPVNG